MLVLYLDKVVYSKDKTVVSKKAIVVPIRQERETVGLL